MSEELTVPFRDAVGETRRRLIELAERHVDSPNRPACDGETTLADWAAQGLYVEERELERCPLCRHAPHSEPCLNMASDNDCDCEGVPEAGLALCCPRCGSMQLTSWESGAYTEYHGMKFTLVPDGEREVSYDAVYDTTAGEGDDFQDDITCSACGEQNLTLVDLIPEGQKPNREWVRTVTPHHLLVKWGWPGKRRHTGELWEPVDSSYYDPVKVADPSVLARFDGSAIEGFRAIVELLENGGDFEIARALEIASCARSRIRMASDTWSLVAHKGGRDNVWYCCTTEVQALELREALQTYWDQHYERNGWKHPYRWEVEQRADANPHQLVRPDMTVEQFDRYLRQVHGR